MRIFELLVSDGDRGLVKTTEVSTMSLLQWRDISPLPEYFQGALMTCVAEGQYASFIMRAFFPLRFRISVYASGAVLLAICMDDDSACSILHPKTRTVRHQERRSG